jgi:hypothetical protein
MRTATLIGLALAVFALHVAAAPAATSGRDAACAAYRKPGWSVAEARARAAGDALDNDLTSPYNVAGAKRHALEAVESLAKMRRLIAATPASKTRTELLDAFGQVVSSYKVIGANASLIVDGLKAGEELARNPGASLAKSEAALARMIPVLDVLMPEVERIGAHVPKLLAIAGRCGYIMQLSVPPARP